jgi:hypothetical protein
MIQLSRNVQIAIGAALALLMIATRGQHFASVDLLPSASWAIFFLAGVLLRPMWVFPLLFVLASGLDMAAMGSGKISAWCLSPAYWALVPAYGSLWLAGRFYASVHRDHWRTLLPLAGSLVVGAFVCYLFSGGGFYFFSGRYPEATLAGFVPRLMQYYPSHLSTLVAYVSIAALLFASLRMLARSRELTAER